MWFSKLKLLKSNTLFCWFTKNYLLVLSSAGSRSNPITKIWNLLMFSLYQGDRWKIVMFAFLLWSLCTDVLSSCLVVFVFYGLKSAACSHLFSFPMCLPTRPVLLLSLVPALESEALFPIACGFSIPMNFLPTYLLKATNKHNRRLVSQVELPASFCTVSLKDKMEWHFFCIFRFLNDWLYLSMQEI